jgi:hypothetical protein
MRARELALNRWDVAALILYGLLTLALTFPLISDTEGSLAGWNYDVYVNLWADWWTGKALGTGHDFYHTDYLFYPQGTSLVFFSFSHTNSMLSLLLAPLVGRFAAYNLTILLAYVLSGFGMYMLVCHLTGCRPAAFVAGFVFAFHPYHMCESDHPVLVTTQWIPLFALAFMRVLHDPGTGRIKQVFVAALWFLFTALSSWHLMMMLAGWAALYVFYQALFGRDELAPRGFRYLLLLAAVVGLAVMPFLWPIIREQLTTDTSYMAVQAWSGVGNDLLSFLIPSRWHPWFAPLVADIHQQIGLLLSGRSAYLGYVSLILSVIGIVTTRRRARFWLLAGLVFLILSLGLHVEFNGVPLHTFRLPWAIPIINVLRHPFRLSVFVFFSLAVLVGFGSRWLYDLFASRSKVSACLAVGLSLGLLLAENLVWPFPTVQLSYSPFYQQLAREEGDFAVVDFPMDRQRDKYFMLCQTIHGRKMVGGVVSRTPHNAYDFIDASPLLKPLHAGHAPDPDVNIGEQFAALADQGIRYIIIHKFGKKEGWQGWVDDFPPPFYEDEWLIAYRTTAAPNHVLEAGMGVIDASLSAETVTPNTALEVEVIWGATVPPGTDLRAEISLVDGEGNVGQVERFRISPMQPTGEWSANTIVWDRYAFQVEPRLRRGVYTVTLGLAREEDDQPVGQRMAVGEVMVPAPERSFAAPSVDRRVEATFGDDLQLVGYDLEMDTNVLRLVLHWQALRRMELNYRFFTHLTDVKTGTLVAQVDVVPYNWTYPTTWWEAGEFVSDELLVSLEGMPPGTYRLSVGVYDPDSGERLAITGQPSDLTVDERRLVLEQGIVR